MENITPEADALGLTELLASVQSQLKDLRHEIAAYAEEVEAGGDVQATKIKDVLSRAKGLVQQCTGLEKSIADCRKAENGHSSDFELNFEHARSEVWSALNRIRARGRSGAVSG